MARSGFTLFEVGVSLLIMGVAVTSVLVLLPSGIQAQQAVRYQFMAAGKLQTIVGATTAPTTLDEMLTWHESPNLADGAVINAANYAPDLEAYANSLSDGCGIPIPPEIARRLDSDGDEIATILSEGGSVFYPAMFGVAEFDGGTPSLAGQAGNDQAVRRLVFGFRGYAQQNLLTHHPQIAWPYPQQQPSVGMPWESSVWTAAGVAASNPDDYTSTSATLGVIGFTVPLAAVTAPFIGQADPATWDAMPPSKLAVACLALRNHARASLRIASLGGATALEESQARTDHDWMMRFLMFAKLERPDDCRVPRPGFHMLMTDVPLLAYDLFAAPATTGGYAARWPTDPDWKCWQVLSERPMSFPRSWSWNNAPATTQNAAHWTATAPFEAAERCRELVIWAVDWMTYEDFEEVPSAPMDSSRLSYLPTASGPRTLQEMWSSRAASEWPCVWSSSARNALVDWDASRYHDSIGPMFYFGRYGADRNANYAFDRGPTKRAVRLRAVTVARFNVYDSRGYVVAR